MIQELDTGIQKTYEVFGFSRRGIKTDAPRFKEDPILHRDARLGEDIITNPANVGAGTIFRGSLAPRAKASPIIMQTTHSIPYQVASAVSQAATNLLVAISGPAGGNPNHINGWQLHGEFPVRDRAATHNSLLPPTGIAIDADFVWIAQAARLWRLPLDLSSITEITPATSTIPSINGLASNGINLFTTNGSTAFYRIIVTGTTYTWATLATLAFPVAKIGCFTNNYFIGHDSTNSLLRMWQIDGSLWRNISYTESNFIGALNLNGFPYIAWQILNSSAIQLLPIRI